MKTQQPRNLGFAGAALIVALTCAIAPATALASPAPIPALYDMGTAQSPVAKGYTAVTAEDRYSEAKGYGFLEPGHKGFQLEMPPPGKPSQMNIPDHFRRHADALKGDGVRDTADISFRVDVPPGKYRVTVSMGDINQAMGCVSLYCNEKLVEQNLRFHHGLYRYVSDVLRPKKGSMGVVGFYDRIRFTADAPNGKIVIKAVKDESEFNRLMVIEKAKEMKVGKPITKEEFEQRRPTHDLDAPYVDIGEPFVDIPMLGVEVRAYAEPPVTMPEHGKLAYSGADAAVKSAVAAFNEQRFADAEKALDEGGAKGDALGSALAYMWLAGWPPYEEEARIVPKAKAAVKAALAQAPDNTVALEAQETLTDFDKALTHNLQRGLVVSHFIDNVQACHLFQLAQPGDPLYWKARLQAARTIYQLDPVNRGDCSGATADEWMKEFLEVFPDNRYARYYVKGEFDTQKGPWAIPDYSQVEKGAPEWAAKLHEVFNRMLDLSEWWIDNKQRPDGGIGGGWGDDVEFVGFFGFFGHLSKDASPRSIAGAAKLINGMFDSGEIDPETGFIYATADSEHSTEATGDTLPLMILVDFGNPLWIERAMGSARLMQNLWTGINAKGHRHFKSDYFGGMQVQADNTPTDGQYAWRGVGTIDRAYWYSRNPAIKKLLMEWSDAWYEDSMATTGGKPKGIIPTVIQYADCTPFPPGAKDWTVGFGNRYNYKMAMLLMGYRITQDTKYLEPFRYCAEEYARMAAVKEDGKAPVGTPGAVKNSLGSAKKIWEEFGAPAKDSTVNRADKADAAESPYQDVSKKCVISLDQFRQNWPKMTTEASATDRVGFAGMPITLRLMTGGGVASADGLSASVSYQGVGRDFAAFVTDNAFERLAVTAYVFRDGQVKFGIQPWDLHTGWTYSVRVAPDANCDRVPDEAAKTVEFKLSQRGECCWLPIEGRKTYMITFEKKEKIATDDLRPDLALSARDIEYNAKAGLISVRTHNIGAAEARDVPVVLYEGTPKGGKEIGRGVISQLDWPKTFDPQTLKLGWGYTPSSKKATFTAVIDPENKVQEINETNNTVATTLAFDSKKSGLPKAAAPGGRSGGGR